MLKYFCIITIQWRRRGTLTNSALTTSRVLTGSAEDRYMAMLTHAARLAGVATNDFTVVFYYSEGQ